MHELLDTSHAEETKEDEPEGRMVYIPHHEVVQQHTEKIHGVQPIISRTKLDPGGTIPRPLTSSHGGSSGDNLFYSSPD